MNGRLIWDEIGERFYETGVDHAVIYPYNKTSKAYDTAVAWNGITNVSETPSGAEATALYADNIKYLNLISAETFAATVQAYTYPDEFAVLDGTAEIATGVRIGQQNRGTFGMSYRTKIGNDTEGQDLGYKLHLIYGAVATPSEKAYNTVNESPEAIQFSWTLNTTPVNVKNFKPTAIVTIDSTKVDSTKLGTLEDMLYGKDGVYTKFTGSTFVSGTDYYEQTASGAYVLTEDETPQTGKDYFTLTTAGTAGWLPLPDKVAEIFAEG